MSSRLYVQKILGKDWKGWILAYNYTVPDQPVSLMLGGKWGPLGIAESLMFGVLQVEHVN